MASKAFLDSNVFIYAVGPTSPKASKARALLATAPTLSVQVLNEFVNVSLNKLKQPWSIIEEALESAHDLCEIVPLTVETGKLAVEIARARLIQIFDANIIAAAELAGCDVLYSEDMTHGQRIGGGTIRNPFVEA